MKISEYLKYFTIILSLLAIIFVLIKTDPSATQSSVNLSAPTIQLKVIDSTTSLPVDNASICITDYRIYTQTDKHGYTDTISIPTKTAVQTLTLLIYKNGFNDFIYYNLKVKQSQKRVDIVINLSPIINPQDINPDLYFEKPGKKEVNDLIKEYKK